MSVYMSKTHSLLHAYTPGEQPTGRSYIKLNTNESPYPPSKGVCEAVTFESENLMLYSDPECNELRKSVAAHYSVEPENVLMTNGSDEILNFAFSAFGDAEHPFAFPSISYGFYTVFASLYGIPEKKIPLSDDFSINAGDYENLGMNIVIANPNAPTGLALSKYDIERIVSSNQDNVVVIDEAYIDFGGESCMELIKKYKNLLVTRTFSKSFSLAGARLGFGVADESIIRDLNTIKYSTNPYNVNRLTAIAGIAALCDSEYYYTNCDAVSANREYTKGRLRDLGFNVTDSKTNFLFAAHPDIGGKELYLKLKEAGILIRHFDVPEIERYNRITIGTREQMDALLIAVKNILKEGNV